MKGLLNQVFERRELLWILVGRNLKIRYKNSVLGFFWTLLSPLLMILIYATFAGILKFNSGKPDYLQFLIVGLVVWQFLMMCLGDAVNTITGNSNLIRKTAFPRIVLPLSMVVANLVNFLLTSAVLVVYLLIMKMNFANPSLIIPVLATHFALCLGMGLMVSAANVFFRDTEHIIGIGTLAWFFLSPIFYSISMQMDKLPDNMDWMAFLNPMTGILCAYRICLMSGANPGWGFMGVSFAMSWTVLFAGLAVFQKCQVRFAEEL